VAVSAKDVKELRDQTGAGMMDCKRALTDAEGDAKRAVELLRERGLSKAGKREGRATQEGVVAIGLNGGSGGIIELGCETDFVARTDGFQEMAQSFADAVAGDASLNSPEALLASNIDGETVEARVVAAVSKLGENIVLKRVTHLSGDGLAAGYVHAGGKLGALVALTGGEDGNDAIARDIAMHVAAADPSPEAIDRNGLSAELLESEKTIYRNQAEQSGKPEKVIEKIVEGKLAKFASSICLVEQAFVKDPDKKIGDLLKEAGGLAVASFERFKLGEAAEG